MQALNSFTSSSASSSLFALPLGSTDASGNGNTSKGLEAVIDQLAKALTQNGQLDQSSPLGNLLAKAMNDQGSTRSTGQAGGSLDAVKQALETLIHNTLGSNVGAADTGNGSASDDASGTGGSGQSGLMTQVLNGLAKAALDGALTAQGDGSSFSDSDQPLLQKVAQFMDENKGTFPTPDAGSWANELKEDNSLNASETSQMRAALDLIGQQLAAQQSGTGSDGSSNGSGSVGGLGTPLSDPSASSTSLGDSGATSAADGSSAGTTTGNDTAALGQLLGELVELGLQSALSGGGLGSPVNDTSPSGTGSSNNAAGQGSSADLGQLLGGLLEKGLEAALQGQGNTGGGNLQSSAERTAGQIVDSLLQGNQNQAVA